MSKWVSKMNKKEEKEIIEFLKYLFYGFKKWGGENGNRFIDSALCVCVRDITENIGKYKNFYISEKTKKLFKDCKTLQDYEKEKKNKGIIKEHYTPVKQFFDEFRDKKENKKPFTDNDAERWLRDAIIAFITKEDDDKLRVKYGNKKKRTPTAYKKAGIKIKKV